MVLYSTYIDKLIQAPCPFCGYNGPEYWQKGTHASACPYYVAGGREERIDMLIPFIINIVKQYMEMVLIKEQEDQEIINQGKKQGLGFHSKKPEMGKLFVLYDGRAKTGEDVDQSPASVYVTAGTEEEARIDGEDPAWQDGIWIEYQTLGNQLINGKLRWDLPPANKEEEVTIEPDGVLFILYDGRAKLGNADDASVFVTAGTVEEAKKLGLDESWHDGIWYEWKTIGDKLIDGKPRWDLPPANKGVKHGAKK